MMRVYEESLIPALVWCAVCIKIWGVEGGQQWPGMQGGERGRLWGKVQLWLGDQDIVGVGVASSRDVGLLGLLGLPAIIWESVLSY